MLWTHVQSTHQYRHRLVIVNITVTLTNWLLGSTILKFIPMASTAALLPEQVSSVANLLKDSQQPMSVRFRALFTLKNVGGKQAIDHISETLLKDDSALLKHECAYCLGQLQDTYAIDTLAQVLANTLEHPMVRHEAGEALGAIGSEQCLQILQQYINDSSKDVAETVTLAIDRIKHIDVKESASKKSSSYDSVDPAPPLENDQYDIEHLRSILVNPNESLFKRYRAMFSLRNLNTDESALALASGLDCPDSALFRHEIAFVLGQMQKPVTVTKLAQILSQKTENEMVRHECAEALGAIGTDKANTILKEYLADEQRVVKESAEVALDVSDYNNSDQFQFLDKNAF